MSLTDMSKFISLILRHNPGAIEITLDTHGWASVEDLLKGMQLKGNKIDMSILEQIVAEDNKGRYSFNEDKTKIRANQGHSLKDVDLGLKEMIPPDVLYHGTGVKSLCTILGIGIKKMSRNHVHLSDNIDTATNVGSRHGTPVILKVDAKKMYEDGEKFYLSENHVWLTNYVDPKYIEQM